MSRVNVSPGQNRDLVKPLVDIDADAPLAIRFAQRALKAYVSAIFVYSLLAGIALVLLVVGVFIAR